MQNPFQKCRNANISKWQIIMFTDCNSFTLFFLNISIFMVVLTHAVVFSVQKISLIHLFLTYLYKTNSSYHKVNGYTWRFSAMFDKGDNSYDFLFAFLYTNSILKKSLF